ncbi:MAG: LpxA family transferase [Curvibacter sp.]|nr:LpxA family transferase [Curvibacter sp.]
MTVPLSLQDFLASVDASPLKAWSASPPWELTRNSEQVVRQLLQQLPEGFELVDDIAVHRTAKVEAGAILKGPVIVGARNLIAAGAYLRGGCWLDHDCVVGPGSELKSSFVFASTKLAHFNFVGDSLLGEAVNLEAGAVICNYRNERPDAGIRVRIDGLLHTVGAVKFGALVGDGSRLGANSVLAPGTLLRRGSVVGRTALCDQELVSSDPEGQGTRG